jgi:RNA polymerase sigma-70 factor (ECF subfamily)
MARDLSDQSSSTASPAAPASGSGLASARAQTAPFDYESALQRCALGDTTALHAVYQREARWLMAVALRIVRRRELADEVLHDAFLQIWQKAGTYDPKLGSARGWIYTVVRHRALNHLRASRRENSVADFPDTVPDSTTPDAFDTLDRAERAGALHHCLQRLDDTKRNCILLAYTDGYTHQQIAARIDAPLGSVKAWIRRGLMMLRTCLAQTA